MMKDRNREIQPFTKVTGRRNEFYKEKKKLHRGKNLGEVIYTGLEDL